jgi:hypothetical protein
MHLKVGAPAPPELLVWSILEKFPTWTIEYVENTSMKHIHEFLQIKDAKAKARRTTL